MTDLKTWLNRVWRWMGSVEMAVAILALLMVLVFACTLAQVKLGTFGAVDEYIRTPVVTGRVLGLEVPVFPGGGLLGALLLVNFTVALLTRIERSWRAGGLWMAHFGLALLIGGEFVTGGCAVEMSMALDEGQTKRYSENRRASELVLVDTTEAEHDTVYSVAPRRLARGGRISSPKLPVEFVVRRWFPNADFENLGEGEEPPEGSKGVARNARAVEIPVVTADDRVNLPAAYVELRSGSESLGTWLVSSAFERPQLVQHAGRTYGLAMRFERTYHPFSVTLKDFTHDVYPGTEIPRNFSSLVRLVDTERGEDRDVLIYMNHPLRHRGLTFYQASFGKNDTMSIFQVVRNPGWLLPYLACALVAAGLLWHFLGRMAWTRRRT